MLYAWSSALIVVGFGVLLLNKYLLANTFCTDQACHDQRWERSDILGTIGVFLFLAGFVLLIVSAIRHLALRRRG